VTFHDQVLVSLDMWLGGLVEPWFPHGVGSQADSVHPGDLLRPTHARVIASGSRL
jgi:hypothetical protein